MKKIAVSGIILLISISPLFRGLFFNLETSAFLTAIALLCVAYFFSRLVNHEDFYFNKWMIIFGSLLLVAYALSFIKAVDTRENLETMMQFAEYFIVSVILFDYFHDKKQQFSLFVMIPVVITGFICAVIGLEALTGAFSVLNNALILQRIGSTFQYANTAAIYFVICLLFSLTLINSSDNAIVRVLLAGIGDILILALLLTGSRGGYFVGAIAIFLFLVLQPSACKLKGIGFFLCMLLPALVFLRKISATLGTLDYISVTQWLGLSFLIALIICVFFQLIIKYSNKVKPVYRYTILVLCLIISVLLIIVFKSRITGIIPQSIIERLVTFKLDSVSIVDRLEYNKDAFKLISDNWISGLGGGGWAALYQSVQERFYTARAVHNNYFQVFVEAGILGFLSYIFIVLVSVYNAVRSFIKAEGPKTKIHTVGLLCGLLALVIHSAMDFDLSFSSMALLFWVMIAGSAVYNSDINKNKTAFKHKAFLATNKGIVTIIFIILCSPLVSLNALYTAAAYNGQEGLNYIDAGNYSAARVYYEEASRLDTENPVYTFQLTKLYNYFAEKSTEPEIIKEWRGKARTAAEKSTGLSKSYPAYTEILAQTYFASDMPLQALESAEKLIKYQPCKSSNYELLARGYLEAAAYYIDNQEIDRGKDLLKKCLEINKSPYTEETSVFRQYEDKASLMLAAI